MGVQGTWSAKSSLFHKVESFLPELVQVEQNCFTNRDGEGRILVEGLGELHTSVSNPAPPLPLPTAVRFYLNQSGTQRLV